jgi:hypothetical protein
MQWLVTSPISHVLYCQDRMPKQHPWTSVAHDGPDALSHLWPVAVDGALGARCLAFLKRALPEALPGIVLECLTLLAQAVPNAMLLMAVDPDHGFDGGSFPGYPWMAVAHNPHTCQWSRVEVSTITALATMAK